MCSNCSGTDPIVPCSNYADAICSQGLPKSPTELVKEKIQNASKRKFEFMRELREQVNISPRERHDLEDQEPSVLGRIKYSEDTSNPDLSPRGDLHSDLQIIERELFLEDELMKQQASSSSSSPPKWTTEDPRFSTEETITQIIYGIRTTTPQTPEHLRPAGSPLFLGKKRFFATMHPDAEQSTHHESEDNLHGKATSPSSSTVSVFGAIVQEPNEGALKRQTADEFGLIHSLLFRDSSQEQSGSKPDASSPSSSPRGAAISLQHGIIALGLLMICVLSAGVALIYKKWNIMQQRFKVLDNRGSSGPGVPLGGSASLNHTLMSSSHNSSLRRSTDSRLTSQSSVPTSPSSITNSSSIHDQGMGNDGQTQIYLSYVDHQGRTQLKAREMAV
eukprot:maker-scaffold408_size180710-snap-gene-0.36 protein:Tk05208 transcript:maker-scaffold408_size180710-snap-gene-0.36-mRNA-1 annotation:"piwi-like rna-mediated gene silencing 2 isoform x1"